MKPSLSSFGKRYALVALLSLFSSVLFAQQTALGTDFWLAFNETFPEDLNQNPPQNLDLQLFISSPTTASGSVSMDGIGFSQTFDVLPGELVIITLPDNAFITGEDNIDDLGIRVTSDQSVSVHALNYRAFSSDGYTAIPVDAWGTDYIVMSYANPSQFVGSQFAVVSASDNNEITIIPTEDIGGRAAGVPYQVTLNEGEVYQGRSGNGSDLTGTVVQSTNPISVFGSHFCANVPISLGFCDHLTEMLSPTNSWGKSFFTVPFLNRENGDVFRIIASENGTSVDVNGSFEVSLNRGEYYETVLTAASNISSDKPLLVAQFMQGNDADGPELIGDPAMMMVPPQEQFAGEYFISTPADKYESNFINLVVESTGISTLMANDAPIPAGLFSPISGSNMSFAQINIGPGTYTFTGNSAFSVSLYGVNNDDSYAYSGGQVFSPISQVSNLVLSPLEAEAPVFSEICYEAVITDLDGQPLEGVRVDFSVEGANSASGFSFTDNAGIALFCYTGSIQGNDLVTATQGILSQDVSASWTAEEACANFRYFLADNPTAGNDSRLFEYFLDEETGVAELEELLTLPYDFHIAYDGEVNLVYIIRSSNGNFRTLDVNSGAGTLSDEVILSQFLGGAVAAGFDPESNLYIGSDNNNAIYLVDRFSGEVTFVRSAPVHGGDLAFTDNGNLYLTTRDFGGKTFELTPEGAVSIVQNVPSQVTGLAISNFGNALISVKNRTRIYSGDFSGNFLGSYLLMLDGEVFMKGNGDMASGCDESFQGGECPDFLTYYTGYPNNGADNELYGLTLGDNDEITLTLIEGFSTDDNHIAVGPDGLIYAIRDGNIDIFDGEAGVYLEQDIPVQTSSGQSLSGIPAATFDLNGVLYLAQSSNNTVYSISFEDDIAIASVAFSGIDINGGDLVATGNAEEQIIWYINRNGNTLTNLLDNSVVPLEFEEINGACLLEDGRLLIANGDSGQEGGLFAIDLEDFSSTMLSAAGGPDVFFNGDLASGCPAEGIVLPQVITQTANAENALSIQPNPSEGLTNITFSVPPDQRVTIEVIDMSGRVVEVIYEGVNEHSGTQRVEFDGSYLPNGLYLVKMRGITFQEVRKLLISK